ncbi:MAG: RNA-binding transcriptional accessory protein [Raineya sp.]|nr:RNA-binding transcriptional accessory protein [Raineya sp.]
MLERYSVKIAAELGIGIRQVEATAKLLQEGGTVPFIARYRKEATGSLDETQITAIRDRLEQLAELDKRREAILKSIRDQGKLTPELEQKIQEAETMSVLEDLYLPYRPKKRTKATIAKEKGLEPLAMLILEQNEIDLTAEAQKFVDAEKQVNSIEEALEGARHIIAEYINEHQDTRAKMRDLFLKKAVITSKVLPDKAKTEEAQKFKDYFDWSEPIATIPSHRLLAMRRGEKELILTLDIAPDEQEAIDLLEKEFVKGKNECSQQVKMAITDCYKRLLKPSMETEVRLISKKKADEEAIRVFAENVRELLMASPLGEKVVLALDPGFRTGCKLVVLDKNGKLLHHETIYPNEPQREIAKSAHILKTLCEKYQVEAIAIGNGTASRETESFVKSLNIPNVRVLVVNESGASIYSASEAAREEFPDLDLTVRGAISIGRRLQDPLAELVKIDPKSIGVGQYQHDVDQNALKKSLDDVVISSVNKVGVELNTASKQLLTYVAGLGESLAQNIINYRNEKGPFRSRNELKNVPRLGEKAFEQCAGFLRIRNAENPLDSSAVHPEAYGVVEQMAKDLNCSVKDLMQNAELRKQIDLNKYVNERFGLPTLQDIMQELAKPGRDPRKEFEEFSFAEGIHEITDLKVGMKLPGIVTNVTKFGAFVDIGVHQDGLVHISELSDKYVSDPTEVVKVGQKVMVTVLEVEVERKRIALSLRSEAKPELKKSEKREKKKQKQQESWEEKLAALKAKFGS